MADQTTTPSDEDEIATEDTGAQPDDAPVEEAEVVTETVAAPVAAPDPEVVELRRGPGFFPLLLGGVVAAGLGYGAAYLGYLPVQSTDNGDQLAGIVEQLNGQNTTLATLTDRAGALEGQLANLPPAPDAVDLGPLTDQIDGLGGQITASLQTLQGLTDRVAFLETLPLGEDGAGGDNSVAVAAAVAQLQAALQEQTASLAAQQAENAGLAEEIRGVASAAEDSIAAAEARAEARVNSATAQAALGQLRIAIATGAPFASALEDVANGAGIDVPEALLATSETGVPTLDNLLSAFPAAARAALPVAIRETAGEGTMNRVTAFLQSQVGGRSLDPQEGDDANAVLSRAEAAIRSGDVAAALAEITALPDAAQQVLSEWTSAAMTRVAATDALATFAVALDGAN